MKFTSSSGCSARSTASRVYAGPTCARASIRTPNHRLINTFTPPPKCIAGSTSPPKEPVVAKRPPPSATKGATL
jgi:hypothetical protein